MRNAPKLIPLLMCAATVGACQQERSDQNIMVDDNVAANADIEALPPDESSATPTEELENGAANEAMNDLDNTSNSY